MSTPTTRDRILDAAADVIRTLGLGRATTKEIAKAAGLSEAALYKHFEGKEQIFLHVLRERLPGFFTLVQRLQTRVGHGTVQGNLEELALAAVRFYRESFPMSASIYAEPELLVRHREVLRREDAGPHLANRSVAAYVRAEQKGGRVASGVDADAVAALLVGACFNRGFLLSFAGESLDDPTEKRFARALVRALVRGLAPDTK